MVKVIIKFVPYFVIAVLAAMVFWVASGVTNTPTAHALPEYAARTGEPCATCHVNPGGGGPRTLRGLLWSARGKPDAVPELPGVLLAPGITDGAELYDIACASCHGPDGKGLFGTALVNTGLSKGKIKSTITRGRLRSGMPAFEGQFTDDQLEALVKFTQDLANGFVEERAQSFPLPEGELSCQALTVPIACGGN
jgi:cytochrome c5